MSLLQGTVDKAYISSIDLLDERELLNQVLNVTGEDTTIMDIFEMTGRMVQTDQVTYHAKTNDYIFRAGVISAIDATNNGDKPAATNETLVLTLTDLDELPIIGETALLPNKKQGAVTAVNTSTKVVTITPFSDEAKHTLNPGGAEVAVSDVVSFFSGAYGEGSDDPTPKKPTFVNTSNQIQIFKTARALTDIQKVSTVEVVYDGKPYILYKLQHDCIYEHKAKIAHQLLVGQRATTVDAEGNTVWRTQGIREHILGGDGETLLTGGVDIPLSAAITQANIRTMSRSLDKRGAGKSYFFWVGGDLKADLDELLTGLVGVKDGSIDFSFWGSANPKQRAIDLGVDAFKLYDRNFHVKKIEAYDHPEVFAHGDMDLASEGYLIPAGKAKIDHSGTTIDAIRTRFMSGDGTDFGKWNEFRGGRLANPATKSRSVLEFSYETILGLEFLNVRQSGIFSK